MTAANNTIETGTELLSLETPETVLQIQRIITSARQTGCRLRVVGAQHSVEEAIYGFARSTNPTDTRPLIVLSMAKFDAIEHVEPRREERDGREISVPRVRVGAGVHFAEQPYIHPVPKPKAQLHRWLSQNGAALNITGGIVQQTIVGFLSTGSAGGSWTHCLHDKVVEIELVDGRGKHLRLQRDPKGEDGDLFRAAGVSLGLLGVIVSVTLELDEDYDVIGTEAFRVIKETEDRGELVTRFCREREYGRLIWWPQIDGLQAWSCQRVVPRRDEANSIPYLPVGIETLKRQVVTCLLLSLCGNLDTIDDLRELPERLRRSRILDYVKLAALKHDLRPIEERETTIEVLDRQSHYHWMHSRFRAPRKLDPECLFDAETFQALIEKWMESPPIRSKDSFPWLPFVSRVLLAATDEAVKRVLYATEHGGSTQDGSALRQALDGYGNMISEMFAPDRDLGGVWMNAPECLGVEEWWKNHSWRGRMQITEIADCLGESMAAILIPVGLPQVRSDDPILEASKEKIRSILHWLLRAAVYVLVPQLLQNFFAEHLGKVTGFFEDAFHGIAMDKRVNHHLVQTKFSEIWVRSGAAGAVMSALKEHMDADGDGNEGSLFEVLGDLLTKNKVPDLQQPPPGAKRFRRQGAYSMEIYGSKQHPTFLLHPGHVEQAGDGEGWVRFNFFWFAYNASTPREHFEQYWEMMKGVKDLPGVRYHWGKEMPFDARERWDGAFRENVERFLEIRKELDPDDLFYTDYWRRVLGGPR